RLAPIIPRQPSDASHAPNGPSFFSNHDMMSEPRCSGRIELPCRSKGASMDTLLSRITIDPAICHGKPCVRGLRYPVEVMLELLSSGMTFDEILGDYADLEREDLLAVLAFAAKLSQTKRLLPVGP